MERLGVIRNAIPEVKEKNRIGKLKLRSKTEDKNRS